MPISDEDLAVLLERSSVFIESVHRHIAPLAPYPDQRCRIAFQAGLLAIEHATGACTLIKIGLAPSAIALMRPQFERIRRDFPPPTNGVEAPRLRSDHQSANWKGEVHD